jgi:hypothetical protein
LKGRLLLIAFFLPFVCLARFDRPFTNYSLLTGQQYRLGKRPMMSLEFQFDRMCNRCRPLKNYLGISANYAFNNASSELGIKAMWNSTRYFYAITRTTTLIPYLFAQGSYLQKENEYQTHLATDQKGQYAFRPGLGVTTNFFPTRAINIRPHLQWGYDIAIKNTPRFTRPWVLELKIGIGFNPKRLKGRSTFIDMIRNLKDNSQCDCFRN